MIIPHFFRLPNILYCFPESIYLDIYVYTKMQGHSKPGYII